VTQSASNVPLVLEIWTCFGRFRYFNIIINELVKEVLLADPFEIRVSGEKTLKKSRQPAPHFAILTSWVLNLWSLTNFS
jgi:hypothetical protein